MSSKVDDECKTLRKGYLNVKLSLNLGAIVGQYKVWRKRWIQFSCKSHTNDDIFVEVLIFRNNKSENIIFRQSFRSKDTAIFRCRSRTQSYAFTICDNNVAVIHLSTESETESQVWMQCLRHSLWPPNPLMELENSLKGHFYASIVDNESSYRNGLLGAYGYLQVSSAKIVLTHSQSGHVIHEWLISRNTLKNSSKNILQISSSFSGLQNIFLYCIDANEVIRRINRKNQLKNDVKYNDINQRSIDKSLFVAENDWKNFVEQRLQSDSIDDNVFRIRSSKEIPESMLNCSFTSANSWPLNDIYSEPLEPNDGNGSDIYEDIDCIYEEIGDNFVDENIDSNNQRQHSKSLPQMTVYSTIKRTLRSEPLISCANHNSSQEEDNGTDGCDMFSKIVRKTSISLLNKWTNNSNKDQLKGYYCEMRAITNNPVMRTGEHLSGDDLYVHMKSFSI